MRVSFPGGEVEIPEGVTPSDVRDAVAQLTDDPSTRVRPWAVGGRRLAEEHLAGTPPWVHGAHVDLVGEEGGTSVVDLGLDALAAPWHVAVLAGPDAGLCLPGTPGLVLGRGPGGLDDPEVSRQHLRVRPVHRGGTVRRWTVTDLGSANGASLVRSTARHRTLRLGPAHVTIGRRPVLALGRLPRTVRAGDTVHLGQTTLTLRDGPPPVATDETVGVAVPEDGTGPGIAMWLVPAAVSLLMAVALRNPVFALLALTGPLTVALPAWRRHRARRSSAPPERPPLAPDAPATILSLLAGSPGTAPWLDLAADGLALVGPADRTRAVARALVGAALVAEPLTLTVLIPRSTDPAWSWCRWLGDALGGSGRGCRVARHPAEAEVVLSASPAGPHLLVSDRGAPWSATLHRWRRSAHRSGDAALVLEDTQAEVPGWCRWVLTVHPDGAAELTGPGRRELLTVPTASLRWVDAVARRVGGRVGGRTTPGSTPTGDDLPRHVALADLGLPQSTEDVLDVWQQPGGGGLDAPLGAGPAGVVEVDLLRDGPHTLVAGTTGAGKSELLQSLVLALALRHPPDRLALVLVDYKGGASLGPCRDLPHVVGQVSDLDAGEAARALAGLRAELQRRKEVLARVGAADVDELPQADRPPRVVVVLDEFRAMAEELPEFVPGLVRIAAQGRSLGIHLVLATQRPTGAVDAQMRANVALRVCLRVTDPSDSQDVVDDPSAAHLPTDRPGRAVLRRGTAAPEVLQAAWAALPAPRAPRPTTARPWAAHGPGAPDTGPTPLDEAGRLVAVCRDAARATGVSPGPAPWLPALPERVEAHELESRATPDGLPLGLLDLPAQQRRDVARWVGSGLLVVAGRDASGRSTTLRTVAHGALTRGWEVHTIHADTAAGSRSHDLWSDHPWAGTTVGTDDPRRLARLLALLLTAPAPSVRRVLLVDGVAAVTAALDAMPRGAGSDLLDQVIRAARRTNLGVVAAGAPGDVTRLLPHAAVRLVLPVADQHEDTLLGVPARTPDGSPDVLTHRRHPGRGVLVDGSGAHLVQVALPPTTPPSRPGTAQALDGDPAPPARLRVLPLPLDVAAPETGGGPGPLLGVGGDRAEALHLPAGTTTLVTGPPGSGRTTTLETLGAGLRATGRSTGGVDELRSGAPVDVLLLDDLDTTLRADPALDDHLARLLDSSRPPTLLAAARTDRAAAAYRGALAHLRAGCVVVLDPRAPGSAEVAGTDLSLVTDPAHPGHPGRGALVHRGVATPVQVARPAPQT